MTSERRDNAADFQAQPGSLRPLLWGSAISRERLFGTYHSMVAANKLQELPH